MNTCKTCGKEVESELIDMCHECVDKKHGPYQKFVYNTNLNFVPKPKADDNK